jgi:protein required for attachment to host cells
MLVTGTLAEKGFHVIDTEPEMHTEYKRPRIWFVVASNQQAYIYRRAANAGLVLIAHARAKDGQTQSIDEHIVSVQMIRERELEKPEYDISFIHKLTEWLDIAEREKAFDQIILVAAPDTLGHIHAGLSKNLLSRVSAELDKELTGMSILEIQERMRYINGSP